jgi:hypothetical protein
MVWELHGLGIGGSGDHGFGVGHSGPPIGVNLPHPLCGLATGQVSGYNQSWDKNGYNFTNQQWIYQSKLLVIDIP